MKYISHITLYGAPIFSKHSSRPYIEIFNVNEGKLIKLYTDKKSHSNQKKFCDMGSRELNTLKI